MVEFEKNADKANSFFIKNLYVDVVYGEIAQLCEEKVTFNLRTSVTYTENAELSRVYSGSPGYLRGSPVMIGKQDDFSFLNS